MKDPLPPQGPQTDIRADSIRRIAAHMGMVFFLSLVFYLIHLAPEAIWGDSSSYLFRYDRPLGYGPRDYPVFYLFLRLAIKAMWFWEPARVANFASALFGAAAVSMVWLVIHQVTEGSKTASWAGSVSLAVAHTFWMYSEQAETKTLFCLILASILACIVDLKKRTDLRLTLAGLLFGVGLLHHRLLFVSLPALMLIVLFQYKQLTVRSVALGILAVLVVGIVPNLCIMSQHFGTKTAPEIMNFYMKGGYRIVRAGMTLPVYLKGLRNGLGLFALNFIGLAALLGLAGAWRMAKSLIGWGLFALIACHFVFATLYSEHGTWHSYLTPAYVGAAVLVGVGCRALEDRVKWKKPVTATVVLALLFLVPIGVYASLPGLLTSSGYSLGAPQKNAEHNRLVFWPGKSDYLFPRRYAERLLLTQTPQNATIVACYGTYTALHYYHAFKGWGADKLLVPSYGCRTEDLAGKIEAAPADRELFLSIFPYLYRTDVNKVEALPYTIERRDDYFVVKR